MDKKELSTQGKKLGTIRRMLWIIFGGISVPLVLLLIPAIILLFLKGTY